MESFADFGIKEWANSVSVLNDCNLRSESCVDATELEADDTSTDHSHLFGDLLEGESSSGADNLFLIESETGAGRKLIWLRACGNDDILCLESFGATRIEINRDISV